MGNPSSCKAFDYMFNGATTFDASVFTSSATTDVKMEGMFQNTVSFTGKNVDQMNTAEVTSMMNMFKGATLFNKAIPMNTNIWNVDKVATFESMFEGAIIFNQNLQTWTPGTGSTSVKSMFKNAVAFNEKVFTISTAAQTGLTTFDSMFEDARSFNKDVAWTLNAGADLTETAFKSMFKNAKAFNSNIF